MLNKKGNAVITVIVAVLIAELITAAGFFCWYKYYYLENFDKCAKETQENSGIDLPKPTPPPIDEITTEPTSTIFNLNSLKVGDKIGTMTVKTIDAIEKDFQEYTGPTVDNVVIKFSGEAELTGDYIYSPTGMIGESLCMSNLDGKSLAKMPRMENDKVETIFCFNNLEFAKEKFGPFGEEEFGTPQEIKGNATVKIKDYSLWRQTDGYSSAELAEVVKINSTSLPEGYEPYANQ